MGNRKYFKPHNANPFSGRRGASFAVGSKAAYSRSRSAGTRLSSSKSAEGYAALSRNSRSWSVGPFLMRRIRQYRSHNAKPAHPIRHHRVALKKAQTPKTM